MRPKFFGQYLLENCLITKDELLEALRFQNTKLKRLGEIACQKGYLDNKKVEDINSAQRDEDMLFGLLAVKMGYLNEKQLDELLTIQRNNHIYLGEAVVHKGFMSKEALERELERFHKEQEVVKSVQDIVPDDNPEHDELIAILDITVKILRRAGNVLSKIGNLETQTKQLNNSFAFASVKFIGDSGFEYFLNFPQNIAFNISRSLYNIPEMEFDLETVFDAISEFANIIAGNVKAQLLEYGKKLEISPPLCIWNEEKQIIEIPENKIALIFPSVTPEGDFIVGIIKDR
ncbi:chemotaxis protein CheX [bacterium]|nr:chemotaxis protein CheX [bacterium]